MNLTQNLSSITRYLPLATPAIRADFLGFDHSLLKNRVKVVALAIFTNILVGIALIKATPLILMASTVWLAAIPLDKWLTSRAIDELAVKKFTSAEPHSLDVTSHLQYKIRAAQLLAKTPNINMNKMDIEGNTLLDIHLFSNRRLSIEIFKLFITAGADVKREVDGTPIYWHYLSRYCSETAYIDFLFSSETLKLTDFTDTQMCDYLAKNSASNIRALVQHGFNINVKDSENWTPLLKAIDCARYRQDMEEDAYAETKKAIATLIELGADLTATRPDHAGVMRGALFMSLTNWGESTEITEMLTHVMKERGIDIK